MRQHDPDDDTPATVEPVIPELVSADHRLRLRALHTGDLAGIVEQCRDPEVLRWTTIPDPPGGYQPEHARQFLDYAASGWHSGSTRTWAIEAVRSPGEHAAYCGTIEMRDLGEGHDELAFVLHPAARGRGLMSSAVTLAIDDAFARGVRVIHWKALVGNWGSRRVAAAAGFHSEGIRRLALTQRGQLLDCWAASLGAGDDRSSRLWPAQPRWLGPRASPVVELRPLQGADLTRLVQAQADPQVCRWFGGGEHAEDRAMALLIRAQEGWVSGTEAIFAITEPGADPAQLQGVVGLFGRHDPEFTQVGYWLHPDARGRGLANAALRTLVEGAGRELQIPSLLLRTASDHAASIAVAEAAGFTRIGDQPASGEGRVAVSWFHVTTPDANH